MRVEYPFLFNFAASYCGGGYKRLHEYARWFDSNGGASFAIHSNCSHLRTLFPRNCYFTVKISHLRRLYDDTGYLDEIRRAIGEPELYYAYGIPLYRRVGHINWFHLQNVLSLRSQGVPLSVYHRLKFRMLGDRFRRGYAFADVISAESRHSLELLGAPQRDRLYLSTNGNDDELAQIASGTRHSRRPLVTAVGTFSYKGLRDAFRLFQNLRERHSDLRLMVIGDSRPVPRELLRHPDVIVRGELERPEVMDILRSSRVYISATFCENSYNGAAEGSFLAAESYISDIPAHRELLLNEPHEIVRIPGLDRPFFHLHSRQLTGANLNSWHSIIADMIRKVGYEVNAPQSRFQPLHRAANEPALRDAPLPQRQRR